MDIADVIEAAADLIRTHGHAKQQMCTDDGRVCAWGALYQAAGVSVRDYFESYTDHEEVTLARRAGRHLMAVRPEILGGREDVNLYVGRLDMMLAHWNDQPHRAADEVVDLFLSVAKDIRNEGVES